jgi:hypothetical protein
MTAEAHKPQARRGAGMRPPLEIAYALVKQKDGRYHVRIKAGSSAPIIVGDFANKREAQAWLNADRVPVRDLASEPLRKVG